MIYKIDEHIITVNLPTSVLDLLMLQIALYSLLQKFLLGMVSGIIM